MEANPDQIKVSPRREGDQIVDYLASLKLQAMEEEILRQKEEVRSTSSRGSAKKLEEITLEDSNIDEKLDNLEHKLDKNIKTGLDTMYIDAMKEADHQ
jgi:hypothetical protein